MDYTLENKLNKLLSYVKNSFNNLQFLKSSSTFQDISKFQVISLTLFTEPVILFYYLYRSQIFFFFKHGGVRQES